MALSLDEFRTRQAEAPARRERVAELRAIAQEVVRSEALTGSPEWDWFARYIEAQIKVAEREAETKRRQAATLVLTDEAKAKAAAVMVTMYEARAQTFREVLLLPKWLKENGERAGKLIAGMAADE